jgi:NRPS condensation-like uncharacterized protein
MNRLLCPVEHEFWLLDQAVSQNFVIVARISVKLEILKKIEPFLRKALDIQQERNPALNCKFKDGETPEFVTGNIPQIPIRIMAQKDDRHWLEIAEEEMRKPMPWETGPLIRVVLLIFQDQNKFDLLVTFCHIIADAMAGVMVVKNLLSTIDKLSRQEKIVPEPPFPGQPPSVELLRKDMKYPPEFLDIGGRIRRYFHKPVELKGDMEVLPYNRITRVIHKTIIPDETKKLAAKCKKEKTSMHGVLCAALMQAVVEKIRESQNVPKKGSLMIGCATPVNIRHLFSRSMDKEIGNFISDAIHYQLIDNHSSLWKAARKVKESLQREIKFGRDVKALYNGGKLLQSNVTPNEIAVNINRLFPPVAVTNLGRLDIPAQFGDLTLEQLHFTLAIAVVKNGFAVAVTTFHGLMTLNFLYSQPYLSENKAKEIMESTMKRLKDAIE